MITTSFKSRQQNFFNLIDEGVALISAAATVIKSFDTEYPFRQDSNFRYFTGFNEPECYLILKKSKKGEAKSILFLRDSDAYMEMWMGKRLGVTKAQDILDVDEAYDIKELEKMLPEIFLGHKTVYYNLQHDQTAQLVLTAFSALQKQRKKKETKPTRFEHITPLIGELRLIKDNGEIEAMRKGMKQTDLAHRYAMAMTSHKHNEAQVSNMINFCFHSEGCEGPAYDGIVAGGENALTLHYINNNQNFNQGDLVLIDAGAQYNGLATDVSRTYPVDGTFTEAQKELYTLVLNAQKAALRLAKPGSTLAQMHKEAALVLAQGLIDAQIIETSDNLEELISSDKFRKYYPHGTGHWLGLDVHDNSPYLDEENKDILFKPGMVLTCEPALYFSKTDDHVPEKWRGVGIRIEDDILITENGHENLSVMIPKEIKEVEEACQKSPNTLPLSFC